MEDSITKKGSMNKISTKQKMPEEDSKMQLQTARGVQDTPPEQKRLKNEIVSTLENIFKIYGFQPLETPIIERYDTLAAKFAAGEDSDALKEIFKLEDQGKRELGLRFDLTVPLARYVAMNPNLKIPFKRYEIGRVYRDGPIKLGRSREFWQCDVDIIGTKSMMAEAEVLALAAEAFKKFDLDIIIRINNRKLLTGLLEQAGIKDEKVQNEVIISIDKLDKICQSGVTEELRQKNISLPQIKKIFSYIGEKTTLRSLTTKVKSDLAREGLSELNELFDYLKSMKIDSAFFDVSLARGLSYYTGTVFEVFAKKVKDKEPIVTSSLAGGGRYDDMIGKFMGGNREVPAVGISFGLVPIMETLGRIKPEPESKVFVIPLGTEKEALVVVQQLRQNNIPAGIALGKKGVSKNLQYADALKIPYVIILGENELKKKKVLLRDMNSGSEQLLALSSVIKKLKS